MAITKARAEASARSHSTQADLPVFLITVFGKSQKVNLTKAERNSLKKLTAAIVEEYVRRVQPLAASGERA